MISQFCYLHAYLILLVSAGLMLYAIPDLLDIYTSETKWSEVIVCVCVCVCVYIYIYIGLKVLKNSQV